MPRSRCSASAVSRHSGSSRSFLPLPRRRTCRGATSCRSSHRTSGGLAHPGAAVVEEQQQRVVAPSVGGAPIRLGDDRAHVVGLEVGRRPLPRLLRRDRQHPRVLLRVRQIVAEQMLEEAADRGAPAVARGGRVRALGLDVIEEVRDRVGVQVAQAPARRHRDRGAAATNSNSSFSASR